MKVSNFYLAIILILAGILAGQAQALAWQYSYSRDDDGGGKSSFVLNLNPEYAASMAKKGEGASVIGAIIEPEKKSYTLLLTRTAPGFEPNITQATLKINGRPLIFPKIRKSEGEALGGMKWQMLGMTIDENLFKELRSAKAASISVGKFSYALTPDDFDALVYLEMRISGRELPPEYMLYRDIDEYTGAFYITLNVDPELSIQHAKNQDAVSALCVVIRPLSESYRLLLYYFGRERTFGEDFSLTADGETLAQGAITPVTEKKSGKYLLRSSVVDVDEAIFNKLAGAQKATIKVGDFTYDLSDNNLKAFGYTKKRLANYQSISAPRVLPK